MADYDFDEGPGHFSVLSRTRRQKLLMGGGIARSEIWDGIVRFLAELIAAEWAWDDERGVWLTPLGVRELTKSVREEQP